jgi:MFS-type transporter involved in bile tolerance (Atg22 family)
MVTTPLGALGAFRFGARYVVSAGLAVVAAALIWMSVIGPSAAYFGPVVGAMILLALGFSLVNAPSTAALMSTLRPEQIGAGSAVNETTRELGGTMGVAIIGSVFSSIFGPGVRAALTPFLGHGLTQSELHVAVSSTQAAQATVARLPATMQSALVSRVTNAFMEGLHRGCFVAAGVAVVVAVAALLHLPGVKNAPAEVAVVHA